LPRFPFFLLPVLVSVGAVIPARANLIITPTFDSTITGDTNAASIEGAIDTAIGVFQSTFFNPITVSILFQEGGGLGESQTGFIYTPTYSSFYTHLVANDANAAAIAGLTANGGNGVDNPVTGTADIDVKSANERALGYSSANPLCNPVGTSGSLTCSPTNSSYTAGSTVDGIISLNTAITYPPQPNNGSYYGLIAVTEHEIDEILGLGSSLPNTSASSGTVNFNAGNPAPEDLFRYTANHVFAGTVNCASPIPAFFSYSGATDLTNFNTACNGADFGDWATGASAQVQDAFGSAGAQPAYGANEIAALSAIGYTLAIPEPGTWVLLLASLALLAGAGKRLTNA
jgi:hypothetical protein